MFQRQIRITEDGSTTFFLPEKNEHFHSTHGAMQESMHIFIQNGLFEKSKEKKQISILEIGYGTGLNAFLSFYKSNEYDVEIKYHGIEKFPISLNENNLLNYASLLGSETNKLFDALFDAEWEKEIPILNKHTLLKNHEDALIVPLKKENYDIVFFDAFAPDVQPEIWSTELFKILFDALMPLGFFITYSAKGVVKRALKSVGFNIELLPGPPGKREFIRAIKPKI